MPHFDQFKTEEAYSAVLAHELTHWTGHKTRLDRKMSSMLDLDGSEYAKEELIAELGSAFLCAELGIQHDEAQTAAYLQSWLKGLKNDKRFIFNAASKATEATNYLQKRLPEQEAEQAGEALTEEQLKINTENKAKVLELLA